MTRPAKTIFPDPVLVTDTATLAAACARLAAESFVTVDTEFMREKTYWPILCVVQLAGDSEVLVVDALAPGLDLAPLDELLASPGPTKVFHAARQDLEIFLHLFARLPARLFDTQIAAMVAGFGDQVGYDQLVASLTGGQIDKSHRFSDWAARPLSGAQIAYAAADVTHLRAVYRHLSERLEREGRIGWVAEEMAVLSEPETFRPDPESIWERLRPRTGNRRMLAVLRATAAWREREAQRIDIPRQRLLRDESLLELAAVAPRDADQLGRIRGVGKGFADGKNAGSLLAAIAASLELSEDRLPDNRERRDLKPSPALVALLKVLLAAKSEEHQVAGRLLASSDDLDRIAAEDEPPVPALAGWRRDVFGTDALALKAGRISLGVAGRRVKLLRS